jgi:LmbE family N-acetylglucosaminyl deacetylase
VSEGAGLPSGACLVVSPHLDDAVFSCAALVERREPLDILTVCAGAPDPPLQGWWDAECGFAGSAESVPARLREDDAAFAGTPHRREHLGLLELQYQARRTPADREQLVDAVRTWVAANPAGSVAIPAGAGCSRRLTARWRRRLLRRRCSPPQHPDHLFVRDTVLDVVGEATPLLYEEVPYLWGEPADAEAERAAQGRGRRIERLIVGIDRVRKAERIAAYASQIPHISPRHGRLDDPGTLPPEERYWFLRRSSTSA